MDFSITIVTCNRAQSLVQGLNALAGQDFDLSRCEIIVVDNGSTDDTKRVAENFKGKFPNFTYLFDSRPGQMVGWHRALEIAQGEITCFIDDDAEPQPTWLTGLADAYRHQVVGMATGPIELVYERAPPDWLDSMKLGGPGSQTLPFLGMLDCGTSIMDIPVNFVWGTNFSIRRDLLLDIGGFHPGAMPASLLHFYGDGEVHVGRGVADRGFTTLYHPLAGVRHYIPEARMTLAGVSAKFRTTAFARSFQTLRQLGDAYPMPTAEEVREIARRYFADPVKAPADVFDAIVEGLTDGFTKHLSAFTGDPAFRDWVLRENYLDLDSCYTHPALTEYLQPGAGATDWRRGED